jgi:hypothetical protein
MNSLTSIGRVPALTKGTLTDAIIPDSGDGISAHVVARYCFYHGSCRKIINDGTVQLASVTPVTADPSCPNDEPPCWIR